jgi:very-short-patch-repair endonuclease/predicted transcriptional regulator of viral defense system
VSELAESQHGVISVGQLRAAGFGAGAIKYRVAQGWLHPIHRGVYAVGHTRLTAVGRAWAAVLTGPGVLGLLSGAAVWDLQAWPVAAMDIVTSRARRSMAGICVHRSSTLSTAEVTRDPDYRLPVTTPMRTLADLAATLPLQRLERLCHRAEHLNLLDARQIPERRPGAARLRTAFETLANADPQITRSEMEEAMLALLDAHGVPKPLVNHPLLGYVPDFLWPEHRLIVEADSKRHHLNPTSFEDDRHRDTVLAVAGYRTIRFTYRQIVYESGWVASQLAALLAGSNQARA